MISLSSIEIATIYDMSYEKAPTVFLDDTLFFIKEYIKKLNPQFSNSHINRLIKSGGVSVNGKKVYENDIVICLGDYFILKVGKLKFYKIKK